MKKWLIGCTIALIAGFFLHFAGYGLNTYFTSDDVMNIADLHGYFTTPIPTLLINVINPFGLAYRPLGGIFYRVAYNLAGLHPFPFRFACFVILLGNLYLAYRFLQVLTGSAEAALLAVLLFSYNPAFSQLYYNTGTIYDLLSFSCCILALTRYISARRRAGGLLSGTAAASLLMLTVFALQAKEIGCLLAAGIFLYELLYASPRQFGPAIAVSALTVGVLLHRLLTPHLLGENPAYHPAFSWHRYLESAAHYQNLLFSSATQPTKLLLLCSWSAAALLAALLRSRDMAFALGFWIVGLVPVCLIPLREGYVLYLPAIGLALYIGLLGSRLRQQISVLLHSSPRGDVLTRFAYFALALAGLILVNEKGQAALVSNIQSQDRQLRNLLVNIAQLHPTLKPGAQVLFTTDPFPADEWIITYGLRLLYQDPRILVDRAKNRPHARSHDYVFDYGARDGKLLERPAVTQVCGLPTERVVDPSVLDDASPRICWQGSWISGNFAQAFSQTVTYSSEPGAKAVLSFSGSRLTYLYTRAPNRGMALITIDGVRRQVIDLYATAPAWQSSSIFAGLSSGLHTAEVSVLNKKQVEASAATIDIDGFIVQ